MPLPALRLSLVRFGLDEGHLEIALQELLYRRVARREDLLGLPHGADLRLPQQRHPVLHAERAAHVVRHDHARRSEEHTSELQSPCNLVCRLLLEKKKKNKTHPRKASVS